MQIFLTIVFLLALVFSHQTIACHLNLAINKKKDKDYNINVMITIVLWTILFYFKAF